MDSVTSSSEWSSAQRASTAAKLCAIAARPVPHCLLHAGVEASPQDTARLSDQGNEHPSSPGNLHEGTRRAPRCVCHGRTRTARRLANNGRLKPDSCFWVASTPLLRIDGQAELHIAKLGPFCTLHLMNLDIPGRDVAMVERLGKASSTGASCRISWPVQRHAAANCSCGSARTELAFASCRCLSKKLSSETPGTRDMAKRTCHIRCSVCLATMATNEGTRSVERPAAASSRLGLHFHNSDTDLHFISLRATETPGSFCVYQTMPKLPLPRGPMTVKPCSARGTTAPGPSGRHC